jgi:hypothetical protein
VHPGRAGPPWWLLGVVLVYGPLALFFDGRARAAWPDQYAIGAVTLIVLWLASRTLPAAGRSTIWICVAVATGFEVLGSQVWGGYHYRFGGIPLFVPFGHGLIYVFGIGLAATDLVRRYERPFTLAILAVAVAWAIGGLTLLPSIGGRADVHGVLWLPLFAYVLLCSPRRAFFAALFIATTDVELFGTWFGSWRWLAQTPWVNVTSGNPPSAIAGGYAIIDGTVMMVALVLRGPIGGVLVRLRSLALPSMAPNRTAL